MNMKSLLVFVLCSFFFVCVIGRRSVEEEGLEFWKLVLEDVPMPKSLRNTLKPGNQVESPRSDDDLATYFFTQKDLFSGNHLKLNLKSTNHAKFLPHNVAKATPFSTKKMPQILKLFGINPEEWKAKMVRQTIEECEEPGMKSEDKMCATSLKSVIEYSVSKVGTRVNLHTTDVVDDNRSQVYNIDEVKSIGDRSVVCHKQKYVYAVFMCHEVHAKAFQVSLVGSQGTTKANAIAVCHADREALMAMNVNPGSDPLCHFLPSDDLVWIPY